MSNVFNNGIFKLFNNGLLISIWFNEVVNWERFIEANWLLKLKVNQFVLINEDKSKDVNNGHCWIFKDKAIVKEDRFIVLMSLKSIKKSSLKSELLLVILQFNFTG